MRAAFHCDIWKNRGKEDGPTAAEWKQVLSDIRAWLGPAHVCITGGEALLVPHTVEVVRHGSELGLLMEVLTHGYWNDQSRIEALARSDAWRVTLSVDGLGEIHSRVRGREGFAERTFRSIETFRRIRSEERRDYTILLKTVIMEHNVDHVVALAEFAAQRGLRVFYQPIEQKYNTAEDPRWWESSPNWPKEPDRAVAAVKELIRLKKRGLPIENGMEQLEVMIPYFENPAAHRVTTQSHTAHDRAQVCSALSLVQIQSNGDVRVCAAAPPVGNIRVASLPEIWRARPKWWRAGCCLEHRLAPEERVLLSQVRGDDGEPRRSRLTARTDLQ